MAPSDGTRCVLNDVENDRSSGVLDLWVSTRRARIDGAITDDVKMLMQKVVETCRAREYRRM
jgi:hypothetical protein